jgi:hypothetical protein
MHRYRLRAGIAGLLTSLLVAGCAQIGPSAETQAFMRYDEIAPKFTQEEKDTLSWEEKLAIYNALMEPGYRLVCRRERVTGSKQLLARCFSERELEDNRQAAQEWLRLGRS